MFGRGRLGAAAAVSPDLDLAFRHGGPYPFVHRGLVHTPLVLAGLAVAVTVDTGSRRARAVVGVAGGAHLLVDSLTATGVPWLYPLSNRR